MNDPEAQENFNRGPVAILTMIPMSAWYIHSWPSAAKYLLDALVCGLMVAGPFAWLWPG